MKRFFACICLFFAAVMILTACSPRFNAAVYEDVHIDESLGFESRAFLLKNTGDVESSPTRRMSFQSLITVT